jgi:carbonic anhydrase/acetyltransferase-like protein (isoleucine patch superfamily)
VPWQQKRGIGNVTEAKLGVYQMLLDSGQGDRVMIFSHDEKKPAIDQTAYVAPNAVICGDVRIGAGCRIMFGACLVAEGKPLTIGESCIVMENAVIRSTDEHELRLGKHCLVGPHAHVVGCRIEEGVFIATGATVLHGAHLSSNVEVRVNAVVHLRTNLPPDAVVPIGWIAVGDPAVILPPGKHDEIWAVQKPLDFPGFVYGVSRKAGEETMPAMKEITRRRSDALGRHQSDAPVAD